MPLRIVVSSPGRPEWVESKASYDEGVEVSDDTWERYLDALSDLDEVEREIDLQRRGSSGRCRLRLSDEDMA